MGDEIFTRYVLDAEGYKKGAQEIEAETAALVGDNKKLQTSFAETNKKTTQAFATDSVKKFSQETGKALKDVTKETNNLAKSSGQSVNGFVAMRKELKSVQGQLATLAANGRENSKLFKALSAEAGNLKDRMADLGDAINLQGASPLENLTGSLGGARQALLSLDFEGATRAFNIAGAQIKKISFKELSAGIGQTVQGFANLAASILSSPLFIIGATVAGVVYALIQWGDTIEEVAARNDKAVDKIHAKLELVTAEYDRQIALLNAMGKDTAKAEDERLREIIKASNKAIGQREKELEGLKDFHETESDLANSVLGAQIERAEKLRKEIVSEEEQRENAINQIRVNVAKRQTDAQKAEDERLKKSNEDYKKALEERKKILEAFNKEVARLQSAERLQAANDIENANKLIADITKKGIEDQGKAKKDQATKDRDELRKALTQNVEDETISFQQRNIQLQELYDENLINFDEFSKRKKELIEDEVNFTIQQRQRELNAAVKFGNDLISIGDSFLQIARNMGMENAEAEKALAVFSVAVNLASSLGNIILGATEAAAATGPLAPFTLIGFLASGTAAVLGAFAQVSTILTAEPPQLHTGGYTGDGGKYQPAGVVHKGEWVMNQENSRTYWDELNAMHDGSFEDLMYYKYIEPALAHAVRDNGNNNNKSFADNIANSIRLNFKNKDVVNSILFGNKSANKNADKIVKAINQQSRKPSYRKK